MITKNCVLIFSCLFFMIAVSVFAEPSSSVANEERFFMGSLPPTLELEGNFEQSSAPIAAQLAKDKIDQMREKFGEVKGLAEKKETEDLLALTQRNLVSGAHTQAKIIFTKREDTTEITMWGDGDSKAATFTEAQVGKTHYLLNHANATLLIENRPISAFSRLGIVYELLTAPFINEREVALNIKPTFREDQGMIRRSSKMATTDVLTVADPALGIIREKSINIPDAEQSEHYSFGGWDRYPKLHLPTQMSYNLRTSTAEIGSQLTIRNLEIVPLHRDMLKAALRESGIVQVRDTRFDPPLQYLINGSLIDDSTLFDFAANPNKLVEHNKQMRQ